jgi:hypothetical protein
MADEQTRAASHFPASYLILAAASHAVRCVSKELAYRAQEVTTCTSVCAGSVGAGSVGAGSVGAGSVESAR